VGPLNNYTIIELAGLGPAPYAGMLLADMGADVIRVEKSARPEPGRQHDISLRNKRSIVLNLKNPEHREKLLDLVERADALIEGFRPGVTERLGVGPDDCLARNPALIYGRLTGWGQDGPLAQAAGHDINYIALSGALHAIGRPDTAPVPPVNFVGDMGGGGMLLAFGLVCALLEVQSSGKGQIVDAAMIDGSASLSWMVHYFQAAGMWNTGRRGNNFLDGGAHFYDAYETKDGKYVSLGCLEPQFYAEFLARVGRDAAEFSGQLDAQQWPHLKARLTELFKTRTRDDWCALLEGTDACFAPVLSIREAPAHPHNQSRATFIELDGMVQPGPAPRFSRTVADIRHGPRAPGADTDSVLAELNINRGKANRQDSQ